MTRQKTPKGTSKLGGFNGTFGKEQMTNVLKQAKNNYESNSSLKQAKERVNASSAQRDDLVPQNANEMIEVLQTQESKEMMYSTNQQAHKRKSTVTTVAGSLAAGNNLAQKYVSARG